MTEQRFAVDDTVAAQAVAGFDSDPLAVGDDVTRSQCVRARQAVALNFFAAVTVRRVRTERGRLDFITAVFSFDTVERALVTGQFRLVDAGLVVTEQRIELRAFKLQVQAANRCCVITLVGAVGVDRVVTARVDNTGKAGFIFLFVGVIGHRHQPFASHAALGIERDAAIEV